MSDGAGPHRSASAGTILVVDDDRDIRETLQEVLEDEGFAVVTAKHGEEALTYLRSAQQPPALILLDLSMPVMDGESFRAVQRAEAGLADIPVVVLSAAAGLIEKVRSLDLAGCLRKPLQLAELVALARRFTDRGHG